MKLMETREIRAIINKIEIRAATSEEGEQSIIYGMAIPYNKESEDIGNYKEIIKPGAFGDSIAGDIRCLWNHDTSKPLGRVANSTLRLRNTPEGLMFECFLPNSSWGNDAREAISRGDVSGMSFAFFTKKDTWAYPDDRSVIVRTIEEADLFEISPVTFPAYPDSMAEARDKLLTEGKKRAMQDRSVPLDIYEKRLKIKEILGGIK